MSFSLSNPYVWVSSCYLSAPASYCSQYNSAACSPPPADAGLESHCLHHSRHRCTHGKDQLCSFLSSPFSHTWACWSLNRSHKQEASRNWKLQTEKAFHSEKDENGKLTHTSLTERTYLFTLEEKQGQSCLTTQSARLYKCGEKTGGGGEADRNQGEDLEQTSFPPNSSAAYPAYLFLPVTPPLPHLVPHTNPVRRKGMFKVNVSASLHFWPVGDA